MLIDTPGVGSTLRHNTDAAMQVLPECDAALFVLLGRSSDHRGRDRVPAMPRIQGSARFLRSQRVFFVLNKVDYLQSDEQRSIARFLRKVLSEKSLLDVDDPIFCISARDGLAAKQVGNHRELELSGMAALEDQLLRHLATQKARWLEDAARMKAADVLAQAGAEVDLRVRALNMPFEELASKSQAFEDALRSIEEQRRVTRDLLAGDHRRLRDNLEFCIHALRNKASSKLIGVIEKSFDSFAGMTVTVWEETGRNDAVGTDGRDIRDRAQELGKGVFRQCERRPVRPPAPHRCPRRLRAPDGG